EWCAEEGESCEVYPCCDGLICYPTFPEPICGV
uniref:Asteropsin_G n=1 Tax=Asteropus TaxID=350938 RepID=A0A1A9T940_9METZ